MDKSLISHVLNRETSIFENDVQNKRKELTERVEGNTILVVGAAGTIGSSLSTQLFELEPKRLILIDINENGIVEVVRQIRSSIGYNSCQLETIVADVDSEEFDHFITTEREIDYIFNLSALKHVRSEKDPFTLMRMLKVNIINSIKLANIAQTHGCKGYFCVSTDKATRPVNLMGATKRAMEICLNSHEFAQNICFARFANVAFSDGSLLHGFINRKLLQQPISAPFDVKRYFISQKEAGQLCILAGLFGKNNEIYIPNKSADLHLTSFNLLAERFLDYHGYKPLVCETEQLARNSVDIISEGNQWPCYFFESDTTGEKPFEEFYSSSDTVLASEFKCLNKISPINLNSKSKTSEFLKSYYDYMKTDIWNKEDIKGLIKILVDDLDHIEKDKYLDGRM